MIVLPPNNFVPRPMGPTRRRNAWDAIAATREGFIPLDASGSKTTEALRGRIYNAMRDRGLRVSTRTGTIDNRLGLYFRIG